MTQSQKILEAKLEGFTQDIRDGLNKEDINKQADKLFKEALALPIENDEDDSIVSEFINELQVLRA